MPPPPDVDDPSVDMSDNDDQSTPFTFTVTSADSAPNTHRPTSAEENKEPVDDAVPSAKTRKQCNNQFSLSSQSLPSYAAPTRPSPIPSNQFPRPHSFPSEVWPIPPLKELSTSQGVAQVGAQLAALPGGSRDRFARWVLGVASVLNYDGELKDGVYHGKGRAEFKGGQIYEGEWYDGLMHGQGVYTWTDGCQYVGEMRHQSVSGFGRMLWPDGATYQGELLYGQRHGQGLFIDPSVPCMYEGSWEAGLRHGSGKLTYDDAGKHYYEGQWVNGARHGYGILRYASGNLYQGYWCWDRKVGQGSMHWHDRNQKYEGEWLNDRPHGQGEYTWMDLPIPATVEQSQVATAHAHALTVGSPSARKRDSSSSISSLPGSSPSSIASANAAANVAAGPLTHFQHHNRYVGSWVQGVREGQGALFYSNGSVYSGSWSNDRKDGLGRFVFANGSEYKGLFEKDQMTDEKKWANPYSGVAEQMAALSLTSPTAGTTAPAAPISTPLSPAASRGKKGTGAAATTVKDIGMLDLPLTDVLISHAREQGFIVDSNGNSSTDPTANAYIASQRESIANLLLRYNSELIDIYRFYASTTVDIAQPDYEPPILPYTPVSHTGAPDAIDGVGGIKSQLTSTNHGSGTSQRMNLAQFWLFLHDLSLENYSNLAHVDTSRAGIDRLILRRMLLGEEDAQSQRLLLFHPGNPSNKSASDSIHDPRMILLKRDFYESIVRMADELFKLPVLTKEEMEEKRKRKVEKYKGNGGQVEKKVDESDDDDDDIDDTSLPTLLYARAEENFNQILSGAPAASASPSPASSQPDLHLPLHQLASLQLNSPSRSGAISASPSSQQANASSLAALAAFSPNHSQQLNSPARTVGGGGFNSTSNGTTVLPSLSSGNRSLKDRSKRNTLSERLHRFLREFVLPHARTRSRHAAQTHALTLYGGPTPLTPQPLFQLPALISLMKRYQTDIYRLIYLPHSQMHTLLVPSNAAAVKPIDATVATLPPLHDRSMSLSSLLLLLKSSSASTPNGNGVLTPYFTLYHCLDVLFGPVRSPGADTRLFTALGIELLFEQLLETLVRIALWRGKVLSDVAASIQAEREAVETIRRERREKIEAEQKRIAEIEAAAAAAAAAEAAAAANEAGEAGKPGTGTVAVGAGGKKSGNVTPHSPHKSAAGSKPGSASNKKGKDSGAGAAPLASGDKSKRSSMKTPMTPKQAAAAGAKNAASASPRAGSQKKLTAAGKSSAGGSGSNKKGSNKAGSTGRPGSNHSSTHSLQSSPSAATANGIGSAPNSSRNLLSLSESGSLARRTVRRDSAGGLNQTPSSQEGISEMNAGGSNGFSLADGGAQGAWALPPQEIERLCADTEAFLCALLNRPAPEGLRTSYPAILNEESVHNDATTATDSNSTSNIPAL
jgi:hypothetical protein